MKKAILAQKVLASVLAIGLGGFVLPLAAQANSGLSEDIVRGKFCVGSKGADDNVVIIDSDLPDQADGVIGGNAYDGDAKGNIVRISGGEVGDVYGGYVDNGTVTENRVRISGGEVGSIYGGYSFNGDAKGNIVRISGGEVGDVYGGNASFGNATKNEVSISGGKVTVDVLGGRAFLDATDNRVSISGGTVMGNIYGGYSGQGNVKDNSITLSAAADVSQANLYAVKEVLLLKTTSSLSTAGAVL